MMKRRRLREASQILSVTPSAVSHALNRLRQSIGDELFIPGESGMQPTQRALELASAVREALEKLEFALTGKGSVPAEALRTFRIGATAYACMAILPSIVKRLAKSAPEVDLRVFSDSDIDVVQQLVRGRVDLVIGSFNELPARIRRSSLLREDEVIAVRTGHPLTRGELTKERLSKFPQVVVESTSTVEKKTEGLFDDQRKAEGVSVERALREFQSGRIGFDNRVRVCVSNFGAVASFLQFTDMVAMLPRHLALAVAGHAALVLLDPPYTSAKIEIEMLWDEGADQDQGLQWLVNELAQSTGDLENQIDHGGTDYPMCYGSRRGMRKATRAVVERREELSFYR